jgi:hypothetical protein
MYLQEFFKKVGIEVTKDKYANIDRLVHSRVTIEYLNCSAI